MCYRGNCVNSASLFNNALNDPCNPNPCQNGGSCMKNATTSTLFCKCAGGVTYSGIKTNKEVLNYDCLFYNRPFMFSSYSYSFKRLILYLNFIFYRKSTNKINFCQNNDFFFIESII